MNKLEFGWDEVHDIAEQLKHIHSDDLIRRLDIFLQHPKTDPHVDPIPNEKGEFAKSEAILLAALTKGTRCVFSGVMDHSAALLSYLDKMKLSLGDYIKIIDVEEYDNSFTHQLKGRVKITISYKIASSILAIKAI